MGNNSEISKLVGDKEEFKKQLEERIELGNEILSRNIRYPAELEQAEMDYVDWDDFNRELLRHAFNNPESEYLTSYLSTGFIGPVNFIRPISVTDTEKLEHFKKNLDRKIREINRLIAKIPVLKLDLELPSMNKTQIVDSTKIFIVHGHNNAVKFEVDGFLKKLSLTPIILHEQVNAGRTIIEKFEFYANANVGFAVILLTGDDVGKAKTGTDDSPRARQNVIFEWGFFVGKLGRKGVCVLHEKNVDIPSDLHGVVYSSLDDRGWQIDLAKELRAAGYNEVDLNKI